MDACAPGAGSRAAAAVPLASSDGGRLQAAPGKPSRPLLPAKAGDCRPPQGGSDCEEAGAEGPGLTPVACGGQAPTLSFGEDPEDARKHAWNLRICMWIGFCTTLTMQMAAGAFLDIYMYKISGSNRLVGAVESIRGIVQLVAAPVLGILTDRMDRYFLVRLQAVTRVLPIALLAYSVATDSIPLLYVAMPLLAISSHLGDTVRQALLADNIPDGPDRTRVMSRIFSLRYLGQGVAPLLQILVLLSAGDLSGSGDSGQGGGGGGMHETWKLPELRFTLVAGCLTYLVGEPLSIFLRKVPPAQARTGSEPLAPASPSPQQSVRELDRVVAAESGGDIEVDWRQETVLRCCCGGVRKMWAIPILVESTFCLIILGSGLSVKFFPLYFTTAFGLTPFALCVLNAAEPLGVTLLVQFNHRVTRKLGRAVYATLLMCIAPTCLLGVAYLPTIALVVPALLLRTATGRSYIPLFQSIVATCVPFEHRGKFAAMSAFRMSFFSASAFIGSWLADTCHSYQPAFLVTAIWQYSTLLLFVPIVLWMPKGSRDA